MQIMACNVIAGINYHALCKCVPQGQVGIVHFTGKLSANSDSFAIKLKLRHPTKLKL